MGENKNQNWIEFLREHGRTKNITSGAPVLFQGGNAKTIGLIISGHAKATVLSRQGQEIWVGTFKPGDFFGYTSLLTDTEIDFEIVAQSDMHILAIPVKKFNELLQANSALSKTLAKNLAIRLKTMTNQLVEAVTLSSPGRVCAELMRLAKPVGINPDTMIVRPGPIFTELALRINSTRETVSRTVSELQKKGILSREPGAILINKPETLQSRIR